MGLCPNGDYVGNPGTVARTTRGCCVQPDGDEARPLTVDSVGGGDSVAAMFFVCQWI